MTEVEKYRTLLQPGLLCSKGMDRPLMLTEGEKRGKLDHRLALHLRTQEALHRNASYAMDWLQELLCLQDTGIWADLKPRMVSSIHKFFSPNEIELGGWVSVESYRVPIATRLPMKPPKSSVAFAEVTSGGHVPLHSFSRTEGALMTLPKSLFVGAEGGEIYRNDPMVQMLATRELLIESESKKRLKYAFGIYASGDPEGHASDLYKARVPAGERCYADEAKSVKLTQLVNFVKMTSEKEIEAWTVELHHESGKVVSGRPGLGSLEVYVKMQPNDRDLLLQAISFSSE